MTRGRARDVNLRRPIVLELSDSQIETVIRQISTDFQSFVELYDERKYPPEILEQLHRAFRGPGTIERAHVEAALMWKYGHSGKSNYPERQRKLATRIATLWKSNAIRSDEPVEAAISRWQQILGSTSFITVCFLLHLCRPDDVPILDQHNFRSVNFHLAHAAGGLASRATPRRVEDLLLVKDFIVVVRANWSTWLARPAPSIASIDRYLMMHGKWLKSQTSKNRYHNHRED
jgi:hypothetical protein